MLAAFAGTSASYIENCKVNFEVFTLFEVGGETWWLKNP